MFDVKTWLQVSRSNSCDLWQCAAGSSADVVFHSWAHLPGARHMTCSSRRMTRGAFDFFLSPEDTKAPTAAPPAPPSANPAAVSTMAGPAIGKMVAAAIPAPIPLRILQYSMTMSLLSALKHLLSDPDCANRWPRVAKESCSSYVVLSNECSRA